MRKQAFALLLTLVACFPAAAQTAKSKRAALPPGIAATAGQDSDDLLKNPAIQTRMRKLMGNQYASFMESFETLSPVAKRGNFLFSSGCLIHACTHLESAVAIDLANSTVHAAIFRQGEKTRYFNEGGRRTPKVIRGWADNLRRTSNPTDGPEHETSFAVRLRGAALTRGFIGGESHDGYVVRARKGQLLTVRLSWRREGENRASFAVSESPDYYSGETAKFGAEYDDGRRWSGRVPRTGDYYVYVVAHPSARYTLKVNVR
ncbi:MAG TPA: hypothetical protein VGC87_03250 [Pyrinomonadaceae bacterium]|jgi:hypothetical protein